MRYPNRDELIRMGLAIFVLYLGIYYWDTISHMLTMLLASLSPVLMGCVIAYTANIPMTFFEQHLSWMGEDSRLARLRRPVSLMAGILIVLLVFAFLMRFIAPELVQSMRMMSRKVPVAVEAVRALFREFDLEALVDGELDQLGDWESIQKQLSQYLISGAGGAMGSMITALSEVMSSTLSVFLSIILAIYILMGKERLGSQIGTLIETYLGSDVRLRCRYVGGVVDNSFRNFIVGRCIASLILGSLCIAGMLILRLPYAMTIGTVVGVTNIVPVVGPFVGGIIGALLIFSVSAVDALVFIILVLVLQQLDANVVFPKVVGSSTGLPGIWVLAAVAVGGELGGIPFILLSVPVAASIYRLIEDDVRKRALAAERAATEVQTAAELQAAAGEQAAVAAEHAAVAAGQAAAAAEQAAVAVKQAAAAVEQSNSDG